MRKPAAIAIRNTPFGWRQ